MKIYQLYRKLCKKYEKTDEFWKEWCKVKKTKADIQRIMIGVMLTQRTNWRNVELALKNLKNAKAPSLGGIYRLGKKDIRSLENLIRPSGFYRQKARRLFGLCKFINNCGGLGKFFKQDLAVCRNQLLELSGIGPETADSILLYAGQKPIFVIDEYTRRFAEKHKISRKFSYDHLQNLFQKNLPEDVKIYQDFHAIIVLEGKNRL
jgi:endonuclease III related protein